jgi:CheY-like chemotaxis protein
MSLDGQEGNSLWLMLPAAVVLVRPPAESDGPTGLVSEDVDVAPRGRLPRTRVLLVEDVPANQIVTATLLRREGHMVDIVADGPAAIDAVRRIPYDLVFMDIFMPGMGGRETAAAIRALPEPARSIPILALTAAVSPEDEDRAKEAGIDGVLSKPVSLPELLDALSTRVWSHGQRTGADQQLPLSKEVSRMHPTLAADRILELRSNLAPQTFVNLIEECLQDLEHRMPALRRAVTTGSLGAITAHAHAMVGMAAGYGMASLETALRSIMTAARDGNQAALGPDAIQHVESELASVTRALREMMQDVIA